MEKAVNKLPDEVGKKYKVLKGQPFKFAHARFGHIDLNKSTVKQVENLIKGGVKHIVPIEKK